MLCNEERQAVLHALNETSEVLEPPLQEVEHALHHWGNCFSRAVGWDPRLLRDRKLKVASITSVTLRPTRLTPLA